MASSDLANCAKAGADVAKTVMAIAREVVFSWRVAVVEYVDVLGAPIAVYAPPGVPSIQRG